MITYTSTYIDPKWPAYLREDARWQLQEYGYILMDDDSGYPVERMDYVPYMVQEEIY